MDDEAKQLLCETRDAVLRQEAASRKFKVAIAVIALMGIIAAIVIVLMPEPLP